VKRQYLGCVGKVANGINTVHLSYVREGAGHALIGARGWIPAAQISDPVTSQAMGLPEDLAFRTKGQLAIDILTEAFAGGVRLDFVCGDEAYGSCTQLREYLEDHGQAYVLRVPSSFPLVLASGITLAQSAGDLGAGPAQVLIPLGPDLEHSAVILPARLTHAGRAQRRDGD
jgi:SRSO17 transposase